MRDLDLTSLRLFVAVCETGNMVRAGERAHIVGSAISKRLAQLESHLGIPLLVRSIWGARSEAVVGALRQRQADAARRLIREWEEAEVGANGLVGGCWCII